MKRDNKYIFRQSRLDHDGSQLYERVEGGVVVEDDLDIQQVVERINAGVGDVEPGPSRRPEDRRRKWRCR